RRPAPGAPASARPRGAARASRAVHAARAPSSRPRPLVYGGIAAAVVVGLLGWWLLRGPTTGTGGDAPGATAAPSASPGAAAAPAPGGALASAPKGTGPVFAGWSDQEADLPASELKQLRGVAAWGGDRLTITVYNGSAWRVTEIFVRTSRFEDGQFVDADAPHPLLPPAAAPLDAAVGGLLDKVAPDRKRPGVNPLDTGPFSAVIGPQPPAYRWRIETARGYAPRGRS
ncbi:MAG TPA: hypothetical protein VLI67_01740, partial [Vicinamibacteria bacterium]|nr:hypothetical protein [Vicinamibacteria bacterium]